MNSQNISKLAPSGCVERLNVGCARWELRMTPGLNLEMRECIREYKGRQSDSKRLNCSPNVTLVSQRETELLELVGSSEICYFTFYFVDEEFWV